LQRHALRSEVWRFVFGGGSMDVEHHKSPASDVMCGIVVHVPVNVWHQYHADHSATLVLETQRGICLESDIERAQ